MTNLLAFVITHLGQLFIVNLECTRGHDSTVFYPFFRSITLLFHIIPHELNIRLDGWKWQHMSNPIEK